MKSTLFSIATEQQLNNFIAVFGLKSAGYDANNNELLHNADGSIVITVIVEGDLSFGLVARKID